MFFLVKIGSVMPAASFCFLKDKLESVSSVGRTSVLQTEGQWFETATLYH